MGIGEDDGRTCCVQSPAMNGCWDRINDLPEIISSYDHGVQRRRTPEHAWKDKVDRRKAWNFFVQIAKAIDNMHQQGILHYDLSPKNVLLDQEGENVKIIDFGLARFKDGSDPDGVSITMLKPDSFGNKGYRASEIMTPCSRITEKVSEKSKKLNTLACEFELKHWVYSSIIELEESLRRRCAGDFVLKRMKAKFNHA